ncbi:MAG: hypothetical protein ACRDT2_11715, partial [Natronosporangium sp.]
MQFDGAAWVEVTQDAQSAIAVTNHGRQNYMDDPQPGELSVVLDDPGGEYNPSNPVGQHYPNVTLGVQMRLRLGDPQAGLLLRRWDNSTAEMWAETADHASLDITGDIAIRMELYPPSWRPAVGVVLAAKATTGQTSWVFRLGTSGVLAFDWSSGGGFEAGKSVVSTAAVPDDDARRAVRITLDVNNGAAGRTITFYTAPSLAGPWSQLGAPVVQATGVTSVFSSAMPVTIGAAQGGAVTALNQSRLAGFVYGFELRSGIDGTVVTNPDFSVQPPGAEPFTDSAGRTWSMLDGARVTDPATRFVGQVTQWEPTWPVGDVEDTNSPGEARVTVGAAGFVSSINN